MTIKTTYNTLKEGETITCNSPVPNMQWDENVVDPKAQFNIRGWVEDALKSKGAKITGKGCGLGGPDLDFELEGGKFNVQISFR